MSLKGVITEIKSEEKIQVENQTYFKQVVELKTSEGTKIAENQVGDGKNVIRFKVGDRVQITQIPGLGNYVVSDFIRVDSIFILFAVFVALVLLISKKRGLFALLGLAYSFLVIFKVTLPLIDSGYNPILTSIVSALLLVPVTFYLSHGFKLKTTVAIIGTFTSLFITSVLAVIFVDFVKLSGFGIEDAMVLNVFREGFFNLKSLLIAGIIIGVLGILDDVTVAQTSLVFKIKHLGGRKMNFGRLFNESMHLGQDHITSTINTLILVYTGSSLPLLLLFKTSTISWNELLNTELVATQLVEMLVGSIGLILTVPIVTFFACIAAEYFEPVENEGHSH